VSTDLDVLKQFNAPEKLVLEGKTMTADVVGHVLDCTAERSLDGAPTITLTVHDSSHKLLRSGLLADRTSVVLDGIGFELVSVRKNGDTLSLIFEDMVATALRRRTEPRKVNAGAMTHVDFVKLLVNEESWIEVATWPALAGVSKTELARGNPGDDTPSDNPESSWAAIERLARERGWRRWVRDGKLWYLPDAFLLLGDPLYKIKDGYQPGVQSVDFDFDIGKPVATITVMALIERWGVPIGEIVEITEMGPANGKWIVHSISRSAFSTEARITLVKGNPLLPEPEPQTTSTAGQSDLGESGYIIASPSPGLPSLVIATPVPGIDVPGPKTNTGSPLNRIITRARTNIGKPYIFGAKGPDAYDCSGFTADASRAAGGRLVGAAIQQYYSCKSRGLLISPTKAIYTYGALLFRIGATAKEGNHVAFSLGDGRTLEAKGKAYGCGIFSALNRNWTHGGYIPGIEYG